jgi:flagellar hook-basal body complex protein FliE
MDGIRGLNGLQLPIAPDAAPGAVPDPGPAAGTSSSFADMLGTAIGKVDALQTQADAESEKLALGGGNLHETALALEKADVALRVLSKVRNKVVEAYQEVMRMGV